MSEGTNGGSRTMVKFGDALALVRASELTDRQQLVLIQALNEMMAGRTKLAGEREARKELQADNARLREALEVCEAENQQYLKDKLRAEAALEKIGDMQIVETLPIIDAAPEPRCSTCLHGPAVGCKLIRECGNGTESRWEEKK